MKRQDRRRDGAPSPDAPARVDVPGLLRSLAWTVLLGGVTVFAVAVPVRAGHPGQVYWLDVVVYALVYLAAAGLLLFQRVPNRWARWGWRSLGVAMLLNVAGNVEYSRLAATPGAVLTPSLADVYYLCWYVFAYFAIVLLLRANLPTLSSGVVLDSLIAGLGAAAVVIALVLGDVITPAWSLTTEGMVNLAYPGGDLLLVVLLVAGAAVMGTGISRSGAVLGCALAVQTVADVLYLTGEASGEYVEGGWIDLLWLVGVAGIALSLRLGGPVSGRSGWSGRSGRLDRGTGGPGGAIIRWIGARPAGRAAQWITGLTSAWAGGPLQGPAAGPAMGTTTWSDAVGRLRMTAVGLVLSTLSSLSSAVLIGLHQVDLVPTAAIVPADACVLIALVRAGLTFREVRLVRTRELALLHRQVRTDELTGLPNRRALYEQCQDLVDVAGPENPLCLLLLDLDRFKEINDALGHTVGDQLLCEVADRVRGSLAPTDFLARLGGDEFAVLVLGPPADARRRSEAVLRSLAPPFLFAGTRLHIEGSIGVAAVPDHAATRSELLRFADVAMYEAKRTRTRVGVYASEPGADGRDRLRAADELRGALLGEDPRRNGHLLVHLQPQLSLQDPWHVVGAEALVRWNHPVSGLQLPGAFLPLARSAGLFDGLVEVVLDLALGACRTWWGTGSPVPVSVNVSASDLRDPAIVTRMSQALERHGLPGEALVVEVTEETLMIDPDGAHLVLERLRALGAGVSIDDFGSGYSSLAYLRSLPADELKLDRLFTQDLARDPTAHSRPAEIVRTIADLAHSLGLRLVAEGIEDGQAAALLGRLGVDIGQGFHLARPMPAEQMVPWLRDPRRAGASARPF